LLDALFPELERVLENGWLTHISDTVHDSSITDTASLTSLVQPGSIVRLTAKTQLFDAEHLARALGGTSVALDGIMFFSGDKVAEPGSKKHTDKRSRTERKPYSNETRNLEDLVEDFPLTPLLSGVSADYLRNVIRVAKGMFGKGLHLLISTEGGVGWTATARLQEGRQISRRRAGHIVLSLWRRASRMGNSRYNRPLLDRTQPARHAGFKFPGR
jgi:hypothetical protein